MNLAQEISVPLYEAIREKYEFGLYRDAILAATFQLQEQIRIYGNLEQWQMTINPLESISQVFGVPQPEVKVNNMSTVAELYEQMGFEKILLGMWQGIRYSRINGELPEDEKTANTIILFIDYLIIRIQGSFKDSTEKVTEDSVVQN
jgi:Protein of unknown function (Hypoth_ymh)